MFHFQWHIQKAIFRLAGSFVLTPLGKEMGRMFGEIDHHSEVKNF